MKKVFALILALVMVFAMSSVAFAGNITANNGTEQESVKIKLTETTTVYHVTIEWLALEFTYNKESNWNVDTHKYEGEAG